MNNSETAPQQIKAWLKQNRIKREELASRLGVSKRTVDNWLSGADPIPALKLTAIEAIMREGIAPAIAAHTQVAATDIKAFAVQLPEAAYNNCLHAADAANLTISDWAADILAEVGAEFAKKEAEAAAEKGKTA